MSKDKFEIKIAKMQANIDKLTRSENVLLYNSRNVTIAFDATRQDGTHVNEIHTTTKEKCLVMSLEELVGGTTQTILSNRWSIWHKLFVRLEWKNSPSV